MLRGEKLMQAREPHWTDTDTERDPRPKDLDEHVEMRRKGKRLQDVELPKGFRLISERVKQHWMLNQLVWGFWLGWGKTDRHGTRGPDEYTHFARFYPQVAEDTQMRWAIDDFRRELEKQEELDLEAMKNFLPTPINANGYKGEIMPQRNWHKTHLRFAS